MTQTPVRWIVIPNWDKFQHYKNRRPSWIKNYTELLDDPNYRELSWFHRGLLHDLWKLYALSRGRVPARPAYIATRLGGVTEHEAQKRRQRREAGETLVRRGLDGGETMAGFSPDDEERPLRMRDLKRLEKAGFIELSPTTPPAVASTDASPDKEKEKNPPTPRKRNGGKPKTAGHAGVVKAMIANGVITEPVDLEAEIVGYRLGDAQAAELRQLLNEVTLA